MTAIESKEEISDTDSGIILNSGLDSPMSPLKDLTTHTRALKLKHQSLEEHLELCLLELRKLCIREAELTGKLPSDYPLMPDEKLPRVRRRIGASFKLDELIQMNEEDSELQAHEIDLAVQRQIYEAAHKLSLEENLSKPQRKSRLQQCKREKKKLKDLQEAVFQHRIKSECNSPCTSISTPQNKDLCISDDSSLSDVVALDDDVDPHSPLSPRVMGTSYSEPLQLSSRTLQSSQQPSNQLTVEYEHCPIQNSPWKESSLDQPYQKATKSQSTCSSRSSSPAITQACLDSSRILPSPFIKSPALHHSHSTSAPSTPELNVRRQYSQSFRFSKSKLSADKVLLSSENKPGRSMLLQQRCAADFTIRSPEYSPRCVYQSSSEDSNSQPSVSSYVCSPGQNGPTEIPKLCPPPYGFHFGAQKKGLSGFTSPSSYKHINQSQVSQGHIRATTEDGPLSPQDSCIGKCYLSSPPVAHNPQQQGQEGALSPKRMLKPPPPYAMLVRTPSLKDYPNHVIRLMPRETVSEELKSWHQRNQLEKLWPGCTEQQSAQSVKSPTSPHLPPFKRGSGNVILQRAADGTPIQWFVAEDAEIVSQV
ncbi:innate immunity activator protein [Thalassophryne amazonica]|uniref:innate immunity activator protein n=1 Tax=Thalassophryne amazonica TaxID=390379 RepID=UPI0014720FBD|nr:innate immunity activator protein [Thalassophryne amazonica]XP_034028193.1 innate immunity activator protein [Thalassophryne amazonica]